MARNNIRPFPRRKRQKGDARERANRLVLGRTFVLLILCGIVLFIPLVATLYQLMIVDHDQYEEMAIRNQTRSTTLTASRGVIYDRNMNILASSATVETIFIDPNYLESCIEAENEKREAGKEYNPAVSIDFIATGLSDLLEVDADFVREQAAQTQYYYRAIKRKVPEETAEKVREFINDNELTGIINLELDSRRYYPYGSMAAQVLGFVNSDNVGGEGLEAYYDATLTGNAGAVITTKGNRGTEMLYTYEKYYDASDGNSLVLTLDMTVQYYLEKNLEEAIEKYDVLNGAFGIVMNVNTGEVLGMATLGSYDPNNHQEIYDEELREELERQYQLAISLDEDSQAYTDAMAAYNAAMATARLRQWRNRCVSDGYEPGSTFKPITLATGLETGAITLNDTYECTGSYKFEGRDQIVSCWKAAGHGTQTTMEALGNSCNIAFSNMGLKIGAETFYEYVKDFGFMEKTGIDLPGEAYGLFFTYDQFTETGNNANLISASWGQTFKITPIQLVRGHLRPGQRRICPRAAHRPGGARLGRQRHHPQRDHGAPPGHQRGGPRPPCAKCSNTSSPAVRPAAPQCPATGWAARPAPRKRPTCATSRATSLKWKTRWFPLWAWRPWRIPSTWCWWCWTPPARRRGFTSPAASWPRPRWAPFSATFCRISAWSPTTPTKSWSWSRCLCPMWSI